MKNQINTNERCVENNTQTHKLNNNENAISQIPVEKNVDGIVVNEQITQSLYESPIEHLNTPPSVPVNNVEKIIPNINMNSNLGIQTDGVTFQENIAMDCNQNLFSDNVNNLSPNINNSKKKYIVLISILIIITVTLLFLGNKYINNLTYFDLNDKEEVMEDDTLQLTKVIEKTLMGQDNYSFSSIYINSADDFFRETEQAKTLATNVDFVEESLFSSADFSRFYITEILLVNTLENPSTDYESLANIKSVPSVSAIYPYDHKYYFIDDYNYIFIVDIGDGNMENYLESWSKWHKEMNVEEAEPMRQFIESKAIENSQMYTMNDTLIFLMHPESSVIIQELEKTFDLTNYTYMLNESNHTGLLEEIDVFLYNEICNWHNDTIVEEYEDNSDMSFITDPSFVLSDIKLLNEYLEVQLYNLVPFSEALYASNYNSTLYVIQLEDGISELDAIDDIVTAYASIDSDIKVDVDVLGDGIIYILIYLNIIYQSTYEPLPIQTETLMKDFIEKFKSS